MSKKEHIIGVVIFLLLLSFCIFKVANCQERPKQAEPARSIINNSGLTITRIFTTKDLLIDSLKKELLKCQEKSRVDEIIIERLFECMKNRGVTILTKDNATND